MDLDSLNDVEPAYDVDMDELDNCHFCEVPDCNRFYPLREVICHDQNIFVFSDRDLL